MKILLTAVEPGLLDASNQFCGDLACVSVHQASLLDVSCDAVVSLANSFADRARDLQI